MYIYSVNIKVGILITVRLAIVYLKYWYKKTSFSCSFPGEIPGAEKLWFRFEYKVGFSPFTGYWCLPFEAYGNIWPTVQV